MNGHAGEAIVEATVVADGPPVIEEDLDGAPHGDPAEDDHSFSENSGGIAGFGPLPQGGSDGEGGTEEGEADGEADPAVVDEAAQMDLGETGLADEMLADGFADVAQGFRGGRRAGKVDGESQSQAGGDFTGAGDDVALGIIIKILGDERGGVAIIKELVETADADFDDMGIQRDFVAEK